MPLTGVEQNTVIYIRAYAYSMQPSNKMLSRGGSAWVYRVAQQTPSGSICQVIMHASNNRLSYTLPVSLLIPKGECMGEYILDRLHYLSCPQVHGQMCELISYT